MPSLRIRMRYWSLVFALAAATGLIAGSSAAEVHDVPAEFATIGAALAASSAGDIVQVAAGVYAPSTNGESFPLTVATTDVELRGAGMGLSIIDAEGTAGVLVADASGVVIADFTITGGANVDRGGGLQILSSSPEIARNYFVDNGARLRGSGINVQGTASPWIHHNIVWRSFDTDVAGFGDPHGIQMGINSTGLVEHNLIGRGDSNGLFVQESSGPTIRHNIFMQNGIDGVRGRGICSFGLPSTVIAYNLFYDNSIAALVIGDGVGNVTAAQANDLAPDDGYYGNIDGDPLLLDPDGEDFHLTATSIAVDGGDPGLPFDPDGTVADLGPIFFDQTAVGTSIPVAGMLRMLGNVPNPFNPRTEVRFVLSIASPVSVEIVDPRGRRVRELYRGTLDEGEASIPWDGMDAGGSAVASGVYLAVVRAAGEMQSAPMALVR